MERAREQGLAALAQQTEVQLRAIWRVVGLSEEDQARSLSDLQAEVIAVYRKRVAEEQQMQHLYREEVLQMQTQCAELAAATATKLPVLERGERSLTEQLVQLQKQLAQLEATRVARTTAIQQLVTELAAEADTLGEAVAPGSDEVGCTLTEKRIESLRSELAEARREAATRRTAVLQLRDEILSKWDALGDDGTTDAALSRPDGAPASFHAPEAAAAWRPRILTSATASQSGADDAAAAAALSLHMKDMADLSHLSAALSARVTSQQDALCALQCEVDLLWERLGVSDEERSALDADDGCQLHESHLRALRVELRRLQALKQANLATYVATSREEIVALWDKLAVGEAERAACALVTVADDELNDAVLEEHEAFIAQLKQRLDVAAPLLKLVARREGILAEKAEHEATLRDPSRLLTRGSGGRRDPGRLLREEKMHRRIQKDLPRITAKLNSVIPDWEAKHGPFCMHGKRFLDLLLEQEEAARAAKEEEKLRRERERNERLQQEALYGTKSSMRRVASPARPKAKTFRAVARSVGAFGSPTRSPLKRDVRNELCDSPGPRTPGRRRTGTGTPGSASRMTPGSDRRKRMTTARTLPLPRRL